MNVAKWLLLGILTLPFAELAAFAAVAVAIGLLGALVLVVGTSLVGAMILRRAGGTHIGRVRALQADRTGAGTVLAGFLLIIQWFITDAMGVLLLLGSLAATVRRGPAKASPDGAVDFGPDEWQRESDPPLPYRRNEDAG